MTFTTVKQVYVNVTDRGVKRRVEVLITPTRSLSNTGLKEFQERHSALSSKWIFFVNVQSIQLKHIHVHGAGKCTMSKILQGNKDSVCPHASDSTCPLK